MKSATPMSDMLDDSNDFRAPLPAGFDLEQYKKEVKDGGGDYDAFCKAFPLFEHPKVEAPTNETYWEFGRIRKRMGLGPYSENDTQYNLIRASCEYLTAKTGNLPDLATVERFLGLGWRFVLHELENYPPVVPLLAYAQYLVTCRLDVVGHPDPYCHIETAVRDAQDYVQGCLDFLEKQQQQEQQQAKVAALEAQVKHEQAQYDHAQRMVKRYDLLGKIFLVVLGFLAGWLCAHHS